MKQRVLGLCIFMALVASGSSANATSAEPDPSSISYAQCPWRHQGLALVVLSSAQAWQDTMQKSELLTLHRAPDWQNQEVVVFGLAIQPHLGVSVSFTEPVLQLRGRQATLYAKLTRPASGVITRSARSSPCVMAVVHKRPWRVAQVRDADQPAQVLARFHRAK
jgi:hypothetical protein